MLMPPTGKYVVAKIIVNNKGLNDQTDSVLRIIYIEPIGDVVFEYNGPQHRKIVHLILTSKQGS